MAQEDTDFQVIVSSDDYAKLQEQVQKYNELEKVNKTLKEQNNDQKQTIKDLKKSLYFRDSFIEYLVNETNHFFASVLKLDIISCDITQSFYQDIVSHEQNGMSSIEVGEAMELLKEKNRRVFQRLNTASQKFTEMQETIKMLENSKAPVVLSIPKVLSESPEEKQLHQKYSQINGCTIQIQNLQKQLQNLKLEKQTLQQEIKKLTNSKAEIKFLDLKKIQSQSKGQKSYIIKLMVDQYYRQLETNLGKLGGLTNDQIGTVVSNQMKGIVEYIGLLATKAKKR